MHKVVRKPLPATKTEKVNKWESPKKTPKVPEPEPVDSSFTREKPPKYRGTHKGQTVYANNRRPTGRVLSFTDDATGERKGMRVFRTETDSCWVWDGGRWIRDYRRNVDGFEQYIGFDREPSGVRTGDSGCERRHQGDRHIRNPHPVRLSEGVDRGHKFETGPSPDTTGISTDSVMSRTCPVRTNRPNVKE